jgi:hypothetical protein
MQIVEQSGLQATTTLAMRLLPNTRHLLVATGDGSDAQALRQSVRAGTAHLPSPPDIELTNGLTHAEMLQRISVLGKNSVVLFPGDYVRDSSGRSFISQDVAEEIGKTARVPVFGMRDLYIQHGFFGGRAVNAIATGQLAANLIRGHLAGRLPLSSSGLTYQAISRDMVDWQQLLRWKVARKRLPDGVELVNRPLTLEQRYPAQILAAFVVAVIVVMLLALLMHRQRRADADQQQPFCVWPCSVLSMT